MRRLSLSDTIFYNLGDCYMNAAAVLDGPCDLAVLLAEMEGVIEAMPALTEQSKRIGLWTFAKRTSGQVDLTRHVSVIRDPSITRFEQIVPRLDKQRRSPIRIDGPPWRVFVLNPAEPGKDIDGEPPLSALFMQVRHGMADAIRGLQILSRMGRYEATAAHRALAARIPSVEPLDFASPITVHDPGFSLLQIPRRGMVRDGDSSERLAAVAATLVADPTLFPNAQPLRGNVGRTRFVRRRGPQNGVGNHLKMVTVSTKEKPKEKRFTIPGLARAQDLPITQWLVALAPRPIARLMMRIWYTNFDAMATLIPMPRRLVLGGRSVSATFGIPPLWGPVPLCLDVLADGENYNVCAVPGNGFTASRELLHERLTRLLNPETDEDLDAVEATLALMSEQTGDAATRRQGQGADGSSSSPVSVPARAKSP
ncbi:hypothetical protein [Bauldia litoralis]|uniref:Diacylglycerol O-acyltransferase n=1 Tax=Bauldia litoralis TaxID=665467 RepID=A0A1G6AVS7_9HYPH|nr:hypothetical protein [Bauldia litoralis]SDB12429.1 hypothetical protein SAMN02982931_00922 [Bauldia litoralis]